MKKENNEKKIVLLQTPNSNASRLTTQVSTNIKKSRSNSIENQSKINNYYQISKRILTTENSEDFINDIDHKKILELFTKDKMSYNSPNQALRNSSSPNSKNNNNSHIPNSDELATSNAGINECNPNQIQESRNQQETDQHNGSPSASWRLNTEETTKQENFSDNYDLVKQQLYQYKIENMVNQKLQTKFQLLEKEIQMLTQRFAVLEQKNKLLEKQIQMLQEEKASYKIENEQLTNQISELLQINQQQTIQIKNLKQQIDLNKQKKQQLLDNSQYIKIQTNPYPNQNDFKKEVFINQLKTDINQHQSSFANLLNKASVDKKYNYFTKYFENHKLGENSPIPQKTFKFYLQNSKERQITNQKQ
eukprot:TRINITY_DN13814_c0_g1_i2.p1 TRINITY_DN13814_c0_g1~~TRINITY_DN13814_c0_g1_i2.p1  ORF type:complete len:363 (+),score=72.21 TRINITY_DN13814_c0_g1_i2:1053-2141(+)